MSNNLNSEQELCTFKNKLQARLEIIKTSQNGVLDISRGRPAKEQLDLSNGLFEIKEFITEIGLDVRNYGVLDGLPETKVLFEDILNIPKENIIVGGNSALNMIYDCIIRYFMFDDKDNKAWKNYKEIKFLCPVPGYDRHFDILEEFNIKMISIQTYEDSIDIELVEELVSKDETIKGIICVPNHSNPTGVTYNRETLDRLANLKPKAKDFKIFCDDAYAVHVIYQENQENQENQEENNYNLFRACEKFNNLNSLIYFFSTSKITFSGAGISMLASGQDTLNYIKSHMSKQTIGHDKVNQHRITKLLKNKEDTLNHMKKHADILRPKFDIVLNTLEQELGGTEFLKWNRPKGGYFVCVYTQDGFAKKVVKKCYDAGLILTPAGSTYPHMLDPNDNNIRIAPSFLGEEDLKVAMEIFCICVKLVSVE
ncbi:MAG: aminotransferase class I/II-fold pyridoxal phosphate-dependent enzyme [bacterium]